MPPPLLSSRDLLRRDGCAPAAGIRQPSAVAATLVAVVLVAAAPSPLLAQSIQAHAPSPQACVALDADVERLACYDAAAGRAAGISVAAQADAEADKARADQSSVSEYRQFNRDALPPRQRARERLADIFRPSPDLPSIDARLANAGRGSLLDSRWELARDSKLGVFNLRAHRPVYLLPVVWTSNVNQQPRASDSEAVVDPQALTDIEAKFQLSFKTKAVENIFGDNGDIWLAYTQSSRWQVYNADNSRPFRESNYEPEAMLVFRTSYDVLGWRGRLLGIGVNHQSNGRDDPFSRSWNRVIAQVGLDRNNWALMVRPWWRISEGRSDDNPDIEDYMGRGDATLVYVDDGSQYSVTARHSLRGGEDSRGAVQFDWGFPIRNTLRGHVQVFHGYGESLIDYNHRATYVGLGISLLEWF